MEKPKLVKPLKFKKILSVLKKAGIENVSCCPETCAEAVYYAQFGEEAKILNP